MVMHMSSVPQIFLSIISRAEGKVSPLTLQNMVQLSGAKNMHIVVEPTPHDVVRTRSRVASKVYTSGKYDELLFWDDDVSAKDPVKVIGEMLSAREAGCNGIVCTPYPKKRMDLHAWRNAPTLGDAAAALHDWPLLLLEGPQNTRGPYREVGLVPMGCTMIDRACLNVMYEQSKEFYDRAGGIRSRPRAMFEMVWWKDPFGEMQMLSEDHSFCHRWRELGGSVWLNTANATDHFGVHLYEGDMISNAPEAE